MLPKKIKQKQNKHSSKLETYINRKIIVKLNIKKKNNKGRASSIITSKSCHSILCKHLCKNENRTWPFKLVQ